MIQPLKLQLRILKCQRTLGDPPLPSPGLEQRRDLAKVTKTIKPRAGTQIELLVRPRRPLPATFARQGPAAAPLLFVALSPGRS